MCSSNEKPKKNRGGRGSKKRVFEDYMSLYDVSSGLKRGELIQVFFFTICSQTIVYNCNQVIFYFSIFPGITENQSKKISRGICSISSEFSISLQMMFLTLFILVLYRLYCSLLADMMMG